MTIGGVQVDQAAIAAIVRHPDGPVVSVFRSLVRCVEAEAKKNATVDTGLMRSSITSEVTQSDAEISGKVTAAAPYSAFVEGGTGIYGPRNQPIRPKRGRYLVFQGSDGGTVFAEEVRGRKATPFMAPALDTCLGRMAAS